MPIEKIGLSLKGDITRKTVSFRCANDLDTAIRMTAREYDMRKSDLIRRVMSNFLYYNLDTIDGIDDDAGSELVKIINIGKKDYERIFNTNKALNNDKFKKNRELLKENSDLFKKKDVKKDVGSFDLTDIDNLF